MEKLVLWEEEAVNVIKDVEKFVKFIEMSKEDTERLDAAYINLTTVEGDQYCVELSSLGFHVVGHEHNTMDWEEPEYYDTAYSLLSEISKTYSKMFADELIKKLNDLSSKERV